MNRSKAISMSIWLLSVTAAGLLMATVRIKPPAHPSAGQEVTDGTAAPTQSAVQHKMNPVVLPEEPAGLNWQSLETTNYTAYAANLRRAGFPDGLVRQMVIADLNKLYDARERALRPPAVPYDAPLSARGRLPFSSERERVLGLRQLQIEKQQALKEILGEYVPREITRISGPRNYEAMERALSLLPEEKRDAVQLAHENKIMEEAAELEANADNFQEEMAAYKRGVEKLHNSLKEVLTPEEFEVYLMNTVPVGTELTRRTIGMEPTDEETLAMYRLSVKYWEAIGGVYERWQARPVPPDQVLAAEQRLSSGMEEVLGPDRYLDYQMATSDSGQQMHNLAERFGLDRQTMAEAFQLQLQIDNLGKKSGFKYPTTPSAPASNPATWQPDRIELEKRLEQTLGPEIYKKWRLGRKLTVSLDPVR
jgi:hypothetical protein